jgi:hypothetical protein
MRLAKRHSGDRVPLTYICRTGVPIGVPAGVPPGVPAEVHTAPKREPPWTACSLTLRRLGFADIYYVNAEPSVVACSESDPLRQPRRGSADLRLLVGPPGRLIGRPDIRQAS